MISFIPRASSPLILAIHLSPDLYLVREDAQLCTPQIVITKVFPSRAIAGSQLIVGLLEVATNKRVGLAAYVSCE